MQNDKEYPSHKYYLLLHNHTKVPFTITLYSKTYMLIDNKRYLSTAKKDFFTLEEKLYILNLSCDVVWSPISVPQMFYKIIFVNKFLIGISNLCTNNSVRHYEWLCLIFFIIFFYRNFSTSLR